MDCDRSIRSRTSESQSKWCKIRLKKHEDIITIVHTLLNYPVTIINFCIKKLKSQKVLSSDGITIVVTVAGVVQSPVPTVWGHWGF